MSLKHRICYTLLLLGAVGCTKGAPSLALKDPSNHHSVGSESAPGGPSSPKPAPVDAVVGSGSSRLSSVALCPWVGSPPQRDVACELGVRATEYSNRHWYPQAIDKAERAHLIDYSNSAYVSLLGAITGNFSNSFKNKTVDQVQANFPELDLVDTTDLLNRGVYYANWSALLAEASLFSTYSSALITAGPWSDIGTGRYDVGSQAALNIQVSQLQKFSGYMQLNRMDLAYAAQLAESGQWSQVNCDVFYPLQFSYSIQSLSALIRAGHSFPEQSGCRIEAYRAILVQALTTNHGALLDSQYNEYLPRVDATNPSALSLGTEDQVRQIMINVIADAKLLKAFTDAAVAAQQADGLSDFSTDQLDTIVGSFTGLMDDLAISQDTRVNVYRGFLQYTNTKSDKLTLRLGARYARELKALGGRHGKGH